MQTCTIWYMHVCMYVFDVYMYIKTCMWIAHPHADSWHADSSHADRWHADTLHADTLHADSLHADSLHADSWHADTLHELFVNIHADSLHVAGAWADICTWQCMHVCMYVHIYKTRIQVRTSHIFYLSDKPSRESVSRPLLITHHTSISMCVCACVYIHILLLTWCSCIHVAMHACVHASM